MRKRLLEEWRGVPQPSDPRSSAKVVGDVIPGLMKSLGLSDRYAEETIGRAWTQIIGHPLCVQAVPDKLKHRTLEIRVSQPTVHFVLEGMRGEILRSLQKKFGSERIRNVKFVLR